MLLRVDTRRWIPGRKYFISPIAIGHSRRFAARGRHPRRKVIERIDGREKTMHVSLAREEILQAPEVRL